MVIKKIMPVFLIALVANVLTIVFYKTLTTGEEIGSGRVIAFEFVAMPAIWSLALIAAIIISIVNRKLLFNKQTSIWTILVLAFCTPVPIIGLWLVYVLQQG